MTDDTKKSAPAMFGHRVSVVGYVLAIVAFIAGLTINHLPYTSQGIAQFICVVGFILSFCTVFLGVIARGFERVEAAILRNGTGKDQS